MSLALAYQRAFRHRRRDQRPKVKAMGAKPRMDRRVNAGRGSMDCPFQCVGRIWPGLVASTAEACHIPPHELPPDTVQIDTWRRAGAGR
jgi:hypothetical protein